jgi:hypothetical protein
LGEGESIGGFIGSIGVPVGSGVSTTGPVSRSGTCQLALGCAMAGSDSTASKPINPMIPTMKAKPLQRRRRGFMTDLLGIFN